MTTKRTPALFTIFNTSPTDTEWGKVVLETFVLLQIIILLLSASLACYSMRNKN